MHKIKARIKAIITKIRNSRPEPLPVTDMAVEGVIRRTIESVGLDPANDSLRQALATTLLSLPQGTRTITVAVLADVVQQARMKQSSYGIIEEIRLRDRAKKEVEKATSDNEKV